MLIFCVRVTLLECERPRAKCKENSAELFSVFMTRKNFRASKLRLKKFFTPLNEVFHMVSKYLVLRHSIYFVK